MSVSDRYWHGKCGIEVVGLDRWLDELLKGLGGVRVPTELGHHQRKCAVQPVERVYFHVVCEWKDLADKRESIPLIT
jgi:hypothetical protein